MNYISVILISFMLLLIVFLTGCLYSDRKRISEMRMVIQSILAGEKKQQIFSVKNDEFGRLAYEINSLSAMYVMAQEKYEQEQRAKKQLISNLAHDVRTPLVSVIGYLEAIVQGRIDDCQKDDYIVTAYRKALLLKEQISQLFEFVQSDANEIVLPPEKTDVCEITRQVLIDFLPAIEKEQITLDTAIPDEEMIIFVDRESFARILQNLIRNTLTHGSEGKYLGVRVSRETEQICIDIADRGQGISQEHIAFVFDRLYKADSVRSKGGGIGLAIARELANKMGGDIRILRSIPGDTVFRITFPETT